MTTTRPSDSQRMRALAVANAVRTRRADLKRRVAAGKLDAAEVILRCPLEARTMVLQDLLMAQHLWGGVRSRRLLSAIPLSEGKTIGSMTERQRRTVAALLCLGRDA
jgi:hypothetical protein